MRTRLSMVAVALAAACVPVSAGATQPGRNGVIAVSSSVLDGDRVTPGESFFGIEVVGPKGEGRRELCRCPAIDLSFAPNGKTLALSDLTSVKFVTTSGKRRSSSLGQENTTVAFGPDGRRVAYSSSKPRTSGTALLTARLDGSARRRVVPSRGDFAGLGDWSSRNVIAFERTVRSDSRGPTLEDVFVIRPDGRRLRRVVRFASQPSFSPGGGRIAFLRRVAGPPTSPSSVVFTVRTDGRGLRKLARADEDFGGPAFSPDGRRIAFMRGGNLWTMDSDDGGRQRLVMRPRPVTGPDSDSVLREPAWQPRRR